MKVCFPVTTPQGLQSEIYGHFGSAPAFIVVDGDAVKVLHNADQHHTHGQCSPIKALGGEPIDSIIVGGIGGGALNKLIGMGIAVYKAAPGKVDENLALLGEGKLQQFSNMMTCGGHAAGGGCAH